MTVNLGNIKLFCTRKKDHKALLWDRIHELRKEIVDLVLQGSLNGRIPVKLLKNNAMLIRKYSKRLKLLNY